MENLELETLKIKYKELQARADKLAESIDRVNRVRYAAVFAESENQIDAMFHEVDAAIADYRKGENV